MALDPNKVAAEDTLTELRRCKEDPYYFYTKYVRVLNPHTKELEVPEVTREQFEEIFKKFNTLL